MLKLTLVYRYLQNFLTQVGEFSLFAREAFLGLRGLVRRREIFLRQCEYIGVSSTGIVVTAAVFVGGVLGYQLYVSLHIFGAEALLGGSVGLTLFRELGPVFTAIMVTGRAGAAMAAQIASMRITEQIDALEVMAVEPVEYLVSPRVVAGFLMVPILSLFFSGIGSLASAGIACGMMDLSYATYWEQFAKVVDVTEIQHCVIKGAVFGLVLTMVACFYGYRAYGGARAVGVATRSTVVVSCLGVLLADYILTSLLPFGWAWLKVD